MLQGMRPVTRASRRGSPIQDGALRMSLRSAHESASDRSHLGMWMPKAAGVLIMKGMFRYVGAMEDTLLVLAYSSSARGHDSHVFLQGGGGQDGESSCNAVRNAECLAR